ncbi:MAG: iron-sulfur cluster-binding protein [Rhodospirillales bacterium]|nr:iron-sulfur cluster-binding protein [Rhodospirillales bacterium]
MNAPDPAATTASPPHASFAARAHVALADDGLRRKFRRAMDGLMTKRAAQFADTEAWASLRARGAAIRRRALARLPELLEQLEANCRKNGITVHWAETSAEADGIIEGILTRHGVRTIIKGKSMVSEEIHLNHFLGEHGIGAIESDLGEFVIQLAKETPSHIIMPCIHKSKEDVASLFEAKIDGQPYTEDVDVLTATARRVLREQFAAADAGLSGVNFAVAETGTLCLVENEGNGRLSTTLPPLHVAVMGIEKVVEQLEDVPPLLSLLTRSATGQTITTYVNFISGPRKTDEQDGPREVHLVLLDNGRSRIHGDLQLRETLACIRCGACMNHCPVYTRVGGHAYDAVYPGPIGKILTPQIEGLGKAGDLAHASSLCGACGEVCPVAIPIPDLLVRLRREASHAIPSSSVMGAGAQHSAVEDWIWRGWRWMYATPLFYRLATRMLRLIGNRLPASLPMLRDWTRVRAKPQFAPRSLHDLARDRGYHDE